MRKLNGMYSSVLFLKSYNALSFTASSSSGLVLKRYKQTSAVNEQANLYDQLGLTRNASRKDIKLAYYKLSKQYHPDMNSDPEAAVKYREVQEAYDVLGDEHRKNEYDMQQNDGYNISPTEAASGQFRKQDFKKRSSDPTFTGKTKDIDFDEYYRAHYGKNMRKVPNAHHSTMRSHSQNENNMEMYWSQKENEIRTNSNSTFLGDNSSYLFRFLIFNLVLIGIYFFLKSAQVREQENLYKKSLETSRLR